MSGNLANSRSPQPKIRLLAAAILILALGGWLLLKWGRKENPLIATPRIALEQLNAKSLYFNAAARPWLLTLRPDLLVPEDRDENSDRSRAFVQAVVDAKLFRQLDRRYRFDTLLFVGDPSQYRPLLDHFFEAKDFTLTYVDHTSLVFHRHGTAWTPAMLAPVKQKLAGASKREQATVLALAGSKLIAAHRTEEGRALLEEAKALDDGVAEAWSGLALDQMNRGNWADAIAAADRALAIDKRHLGALAVKTQCLFATKRFSEAYTVSQRLLALLPQDPNILFKHAQIAHEAHAYKAEIDALEKLIARAEEVKRDTTGYYLYLAQAYTAAGNGPKAIENFERVLRDPTIPADQREFSRDSIQRIKSRIGM